MEVKSEPLELPERQKVTEDLDQMTLAQFSHFSQFSKTWQQLPPAGTLKRTRNERKRRNPKLLWVSERPPAPPPPPPPPCSSPDHKQQVRVPDEAEMNKRQKTCRINDEAGSTSMKKAKQLQMKLAIEKMPTFMKFMRPSHVSGCFWLKLPADFCELNLSKEDCIITLVDESGEEYKTKYLAEKVALSGGWKAFSVAHKLVPEDTLLFQLINASKFKVYIIRGKVAKEEILIEEDNVDEGVSPHLSDLEENNQYAIPPGSIYNPGPPGVAQFENDSEVVVGSQALEGISMATTTLEFKNVKRFEDFTIIVNGWNIDSELPVHVRTKYYELCCSQKAFLHEDLTPVISCKLITEIISGTVDVADFIRCCNLSTTSKNDFTNWSKCLDAFESMGMNVGFLRVRMQQLVKLYNEAVVGRDSLEKKIRDLEVMLMKLRKVYASKEREIETLKWEAERHDVKFKAEVNALW
ncbi:B3 domain-containing protein Os01g0234100-like [Macadamia integrifolia]|uniref:B3 domain-containing protein Os01g0234100-like n=1 Tax=Macadamia integrifolia TaxID=60698 RepID=UPI001C4F4D41|nr:B3 domain-containing protein Os01g0234100-like [Macadamia integrifolia]